MIKVAFFLFDVSQTYVRLEASRQKQERITDGSKSADVERRFISPSEILRKSHVMVQLCELVGPSCSCGGH